MMLMTRGMNDNTFFDPSDAIFTGFSGMAKMFDSPDSYPVLFSDTGDTAGISVMGARQVSFCIVMAKRENSGLSAR